VIARHSPATLVVPQSRQVPEVFASQQTGPRRSPTADDLERRYLALHEGDREAAARNLAVDLIMVELRALSVDPMPGPAATRRLQRAAVTASGVLRLPMGHAQAVYEDTVEHAVERMLPAPFGAAGRPITRREAAALTTRRAA
jgi:hypothetical protein